MSAADKGKILALVAGSSLPRRCALSQLGLAKSTYYRWLARQAEGSLLSRVPRYHRSYDAGPSAILFGHRTGWQPSSAGVCGVQYVRRCVFVAGDTLDSPPRQRGGDQDTLVHASRPGPLGPYLPCVAVCTRRDYELLSSDSLPRRPTMVGYPVLDDIYNIVIVLFVCGGGVVLGHAKPCGRTGVPPSDLVGDN